MKSYIDTVAAKGFTSVVGAIPADFDAVVVVVGMIWFASLVSGNPQGSK